jgi:hypothetical protein
MMIPVLLFAAMVLLVAAGCSGDNPKSREKAEVFVLETYEITLSPGEQKDIKVKTGKPETAEADKESGVTAKVEGDKVTVSASKDAKEGTHTVIVKGGKAPEGTVKVNVKKGPPPTGR